MSFNDFRNFCYLNELIFANLSNKIFLLYLTGKSNPSKKELIEITKQKKLKKNEQLKYIVENNLIQCLESIELNNKKYENIFFIGSGYNSKVYYGILNNVKYAIKFSFNNIQQTNLQYNLQLQLYNYLKKFQSHIHIVKPLENLNFPKNDNFCIKYKNYLPKENNKETNLNILITEYLSMSNVEDFFKIKKESEQDFTETVLYIIFQVILTLHQVKQSFPKFYHNDLNTGNIMLKKIPRNTILKYYINNKKIHLKSLDFYCLLNDFEFSELKLGENKKLHYYYEYDNNKLLKNYYDIYRFIGAMYSLIDEYKIKVSDECLKFIKYISLADKKLDFEYLNQSLDTCTIVHNRKINFRKFYPQKLLTHEIFNFLFL